MSYQVSPVEARLLKCAREMIDVGLSRGTSGNCSMRLADGADFLVMPFGVPVQELSEARMVRMGFDGNAKSPGKPSSGCHFHRDTWLQGRKVCLLGNHGMIAVGNDLGAAFALAAEVESLCEQYLHTQREGEPALFSEQEMDDVIEQFMGYGRQVQKQ